MHYITFAQVRVCTLQCLIASWIICNTYPTVSTVPRPVCPRFLKLCRSHQRIPPGVIANYRELQSVKFGQAATTGKFRNVLGCNWMANKRYPSRDGAVWRRSTMWAFFDLFYFLRGVFPFWTSFSETAVSKIGLMQNRRASRAVTFLWLKYVLAFVHLDIHLAIYQNCKYTSFM